MKISNIKTFTIAALFAFSAMSLNAQTLTNYFMGNKPTISYYNPAFNPQYKFYLTIFDGYANLANSGFAINDAFKSVNNGEKYILDLDNIYGNLKSKNYTYADLNLSLLNFGFNLTEGYVNVGFNIKSSAMLTYPDDLIKLKNGTYYGQDQENVVDLSGIRLNGNAYAELSLGYSREITDKLTVGVALKRLHGIGNITTKKSKIAMETASDMYDLTFNTNVEACFATFAEYEVIYDSTGRKITDIKSEKFDNFKDDWKELIKIKNGGWAIDLGATYKLLPKLTLAASVTDLGFIRWKKGANRVVSTTDGDWTYSGGAVDFNDFGNFGDTIKAELEEHFTPSDGGKKYTSMLNTKLYLSAKYDLNKIISGGIMYRGMFEARKLINSLTTEVVFSLGNVTQIGVAHSIINRKANLWGLSWIQNIGPLQFNVSLDQFAPAFWALNDGSMADRWIRNANTVNCQVGMSLVFGRKKINSYGLVEE